MGMCHFKNQLELCSCERPRQSRETREGGLHALVCAEFFISLEPQVHFHQEANRILQNWCLRPEGRQPRDEIFG